MKYRSEQVRLSATDLSNHLSCRYLTAADLQVARGDRPAPAWNNPDTFVLQQRGLAHERAYLDHLESRGLRVLNLESYKDENAAIAAARDAMRDGFDVIAQAAFAGEGWFGRADVLRRVSRPSKLGAWSYEVYDCKLARETKAATILQLSLYSELVAAIQGHTPESMYVITPGRGFAPEEYRLLDFDAYYRYVKARLERAIVGPAPELYPEPKPHCDVCRWQGECDARRRRDDHLSLVAGITTLQRKQLERWNTPTMAELARLPVPLPSRPAHGAAESYVRVREQARVQVEGRTRGTPVREMLPIAPGDGLCRLPEPSPGDVFFDLEGDPFIDNGGREYLFGFVAETADGRPEYHHRWSLTPEDEKAAFQWFIDYVMERWNEHPAMHIYHYAAYEPGALKRLMGRYATREEEVDRMLRARLLVDLRTVARQSVRASVEEYSLKALEVFHSFTRATPLDQARHALRQMEHALELAQSTDLDETVRDTIRGYNAEDCHSTRSLRDWLERERAAMELSGAVVPRPVISDGAPSEDLSDQQQRVARLVEELTRGIPADAALRTEEQAGRWLLANLLDWHRREKKFEWSEFYRLSDTPDEELLFERSALGGLRHLARLDSAARVLPTDRYSFEKQETKVRAGDEVCRRDVKVGTIVSIDLIARTVDIKKKGKTVDFHPSAIFVDGSGFNPRVMADSLVRLAEWVIVNGLDAPGSFRAARDLLLCRPPRVRGDDGPRVRDDESSLDAAKRIGLSLDDSTLAIQGPPGSGKTYTGARMICALAAQGKKIGVTANSHQVIRKLLDEVVDAARECGLKNLKVVQKIGEGEEDQSPGIQTTRLNDEALAALDSSGPVVLGGTSWLWAREEFREALDVLFVDEAGQMSLANALAVSPASRSMVLLGDPRQLEQPLKGSHPEGADVSALEHLLAGAKTMPPDRGLFLERTWRLHPGICDFTSSVFYESRLRPHPGLDQQRIEGHPWLGAAGLWYVPVSHEGNQNASSEEVQRIQALIGELLQPGVTWVNAKGERSQLRLDDILIIAPYNAQVSDLAARIKGARIGTVDKFQGQEAPVVIYSLTTSSPEDAPRGMEFLYSLNRLNVATSRARAIVILVGSPRLLEPECRNVRQMQLASALCRYAELARTREDEWTAATP